jgi:hypothetical protein
MPGLISYLNSTGFKEPEEALSQPETIKLFLPSHFTDISVRHGICSDSLAEIETRLREAQMSEALGELRRQLRKRLYAGMLKNKNGNGQEYWLRSNTFIAQIQTNVRGAQQRYNRARAAMLHLSPSGDWQQTYRKLEEGDIRGMSEKSVRQEEAATLRRTRKMAGLDSESDSDDDSDAEEEVSVDEHDWLKALQPFDDPRSVLGEGYRTLSWIWYGFAPGTMSDETKAEVEKGGCHILLGCCEIEGVLMQGYASNGLELGLGHFGGRRN